MLTISDLGQMMTTEDPRWIGPECSVFQTFRYDTMPASCFMQLPTALTVDLDGLVILHRTLHGMASEESDIIAALLCLSFV
jgi:hypothetical protein